MSKRSYYVYILASRSGTLYVGVTNDLERRVLEHRSGLVEGFTKQFNVTRLVYFEDCGEVQDALSREKQLKGWRRSKKVGLIETLNPTWEDLGDTCHPEARSAEGSRAERDPSLRSG